ncbi:MAG: hypothetical protein ACYTGW_12480 [Planctomycetota bacterium]|jgi:hypothetical protein
MKQRGKTAAFLLIFGLSACATQSSAVRSAMVQSPDLHRLSPSDIAVLPIEDRTSDKTVSRLLSHMRAQINRALPQRKYSPVSTQAVDAAFGTALPVDGSSIIQEAVLKKLAGKADEDAVLAVQISRWDQSSLMANAIVRFAAEVTLFGSKEGRPLWSGDLQGQLKAGGANPAPRGPKDRARAAADEFVAQLIDRLPRRRTGGQ